MRRRVHIGAFFRHLFLILGGLISLFPFYWMFVLASRPSSVIYKYPPVLTPGNRLGENVHTITDKVNIWAAMANTALVATTVSVLVLLISSLAAFAFAKFDFPGRNVLFVIVLATFLLPTQLATIPQFVLMSKIGWVGDLKAVIVPSLASSFGVFWLRQYATNAIPKAVSYTHLTLPTICSV